MDNQQQAPDPLAQLQSAFESRLARLDGIAKAIHANQIELANMTLQGDNRGKFTESYNDRMTKLLEEHGNAKGFLF